MSLLLALMCYYHCEDGQLILHYYEHDRYEETDTYEAYVLVKDVEKDKILENVQNLKETFQVWVISRNRLTNNTRSVIVCEGISYEIVYYYISCSGTPPFILMHCSIP